MAVREQVDATAELRRRLYRPDPPDGAVQAYLEALARLPTVPEPVRHAPPAPRATRTRRQRLVGAAAIGGAAVLLLGAAAGVGMTTAEAPPPPRATATSAAPTAAATPRGPDNRFPPVPGAVVGVMAGDGPTTGVFDAGGERVVVGVLCSGGGVLTLRLGAEPATELACENRAEGLAMLSSAAAFEDLAVAVETTGPVGWSLAIGTLDGDG